MWNMQNQKSYNRNFNQAYGPALECDLFGIAIGILKLLFESKQHAHSNVIHVYD